MARICKARYIITMSIVYNRDAILVSKLCSVEQHTWPHDDKQFSHEDKVTGYYYGKTHQKPNILITLVKQYHATRPGLVAWYCLTSVVII